MNSIMRSYIKKDDTTSRQWSQSLGNNDKKWFRITEQRVQNLQITFDMCYHREYMI
jgi:hypothetical protein